MSDYIIKQTTLQRFVKETEQSKRDCIHINTIKRLLDDVDTVDEKEIIRKTVERIVERLGEAGNKYFNMGDIYGFSSINEAIEICKEEGGIE